jgi:ribosomal protein S18 acetylase RimI-like enzyme
LIEQVIIEPLGDHDRDGFSCGVEPLDRYFRQQVTQDIRRYLTNCFVAVGADSGILAGYFTFAASSIALDDLPADETKKLPRYRTLPAGLIGRLGVDIRFRKRGIGSVLLADAAKRASQATPAVFALLVDAKDDAAIAFYRHHGFAALQSEPRRLFLPVASAARLFATPKT